MARASMATIRNVLIDSGVNWASVGGDWDSRFTRAVSLIEDLAPPGMTSGFDLAQESE